jgi:hypothetical protein
MQNRINYVNKSPIDELFVCELTGDRRDVGIPDQGDLEKISHYENIFVGCRCK